MLSKQEARNNEQCRKQIFEIENLLKVWRIRNLPIEVTFSILKTLAISKIVHKV